MLIPRMTWNAVTMLSTSPTRWSAGRSASIWVTRLWSAARSSRTVTIVPSAEIATLASTAWNAESTALGRTSGPSPDGSGGMAPNGSFVTGSFNRTVLDEADKGVLQCFPVAGPREHDGAVVEPERHLLGPARRGPATAERLRARSRADVADLRDRVGLDRLHALAQRLGGQLDAVHL